MDYLLDTHTVLWFINEDKRLSSKALKTIKPADTICYISIASLWEVSIKASINKLVLHRSFKELEKQISDNDIRILPITFKDLLILYALPHHHRDPFDRIIISQSMTNKLTVITKDPAFENYDVKLLW